MMLSPRQLCQVFLPIGIVLIVSLLYLLSMQPVLGFQFDYNNKDQLIVTEASTLLAERGLQKGDRVIAIVSKEGETTLSRQQLPVSLAERKLFFSDIAEYYLQQHRLQRALSESVRMRLADGREVISELQRVDIKALPLSVFSTMLCGFLAWLLTMLIWIWYPSKPSAICIMVNGFGFFLMAVSSALLTEGLAIFDLGFSLTLHYFFVFGHVLFLIFGVLVLAYFPVRLVNARIIKNAIFALAIVIVFGTVLSKWQPLQSWQDQRILFSNFELYGLITGCFAIAIGLCVSQWFATTGVANKRNQLYWVIAAWMTAPFIYITFYMLPMLIGEVPPLSRPMTWGVMLICYVLLLFVIRRFDLLYLDMHIKRASIWVSLSVMFIILDLVVLITAYINIHWSLLGMLLLVLWGYVPLRYFVRRYMKNQFSVAKGSEIPSAVNYLFQHETIESEAITSSKSWKGLLNQAFKPMLIKEIKKDAPSRVTNFGQGMFIEKNPYSSALLLSHADRGGRSFNREDLVILKILYMLFTQTQQFKSAFLAGQKEERQRVRRDIHDQIAFRLVSIIYAKDVAKAQSIAKETLTELRLLVKALEPKLMALSALLIDLKALASEFCKSTPLALSWGDSTGKHDFHISGRQYVNLVSILRELMVNVHRHSAANKVRIGISVSAEILKIEVHDNGIGISDVRDVYQGNGISNLRSRIKEINGTITWAGESGTRVNISVPLRT